MTTKLTCRHCFNEVEVALYFSDARIITREYPNAGSCDYEAVVHGKAICPRCGATIEKPFRKHINKSDIIKLAGGYEE